MRYINFIRSDCNSLSTKSPIITKFSTSTILQVNNNTLVLAKLRVMAVLRLKESLAYGNKKIHIQNNFLKRHISIILIEKQILIFSVYNILSKKY